MSERYDAVIIGAGLGGLAAGSLLARRGKKILVLERQAKPGGYATSFSRGAFTFDVALRALNGAKPGTLSYRCLQECGVADRVELIPLASVYRLVTDDGEMLVEPGDLTGYRRKLAKRFPGEAANIGRLLDEAGNMFRDMSRYMATPLPHTLKLAMMPLLFPRLARYEHMTVHEFFSLFTANERLKEALSAQWLCYGLPSRRLAFSYFSYPFYDFLAHGGYSVKGGAQALSDALVDVIREHGGRVELSSGATRIHVDRQGVVGVSARRLGRIATSRVISNISPEAIVGMIGEEVFPASFLTRLRNMRPAMSGFQVYLGLDCPLGTLGIEPDECSHYFAYDLDSQSQYKKMLAGDAGDDRVGWSLNFFSNVDPGLVPHGKSSVGLFTMVPGKDWLGLPPDVYRQKKAELVRLLIAKAESRVPGLSAHIELIEAGTPQTMANYTRNEQGSINGFEQSVQQAGIRKRFPMRYPLNGLYQVGAWTFPGGGGMGAMLSARELVNQCFPARRLLPAWLSPRTGSAHREGGFPLGSPK
ncbi:phytoene desaturase family protein [Paludibacterium paludis]|uniref:Amine oxidase domain-containing protein n=1 Tax=Paludibacterium paludis TaxID=1225769 RepID=A0A918P483_9NEIS|nr:NAD(P)/FAD-dependent oxidoreductase [Paludibacterium paludis]GGY17507.1 hypothetical protein GCM10011289_21200 [Paludibacterium paludis]